MKNKHEIIEYLLTENEEGTPKWLTIVLLVLFVIGCFTVFYVEGTEINMQNNLK